MNRFVLIFPFFSLSKFERYHISIKIFSKSNLTKLYIYIYTSYLFVFSKIYNYLANIIAIKRYD